METAAAEKIERLRKLFAGDAGFEVVDGPVVVASSQLDAAEGEIGQKRLGHHGPRPLEGVASLVPVAEVRRRVAEIDQGLEVGASQLEDPPERRLGDLGLAGGERRFTDEAPELIVAGAGFSELGQDVVHGVEIAIEKGGFEVHELAGKRLGGVTVVSGVGEDSACSRAEPASEIARGELAIRRPFPSVGDLGSGDDALVFEEVGDVLDPGMGDREAVLEVAQSLTEGRDRRADLSDRLFEGGDPLEKMLVELFLGLEQDLVVGLDLGLLDPRHDQQEVAAVPAVFETVGVGDAAELTQHRFSPPGRCRNRDPIFARGGRHPPCG